uniref:hypothetical protein n=1 Tax=Nonomuraea sp. CA-251285 TaxID=3240002 RepID=UPI003F499DA5
MPYRKDQLVEAVPIETREQFPGGGHGDGVWARARVLRRAAGFSDYYIIRFEEDQYRNHALSRGNYANMDIDYARTYHVSSLRPVADADAKGGADV